MNKIELVEHLLTDSNIDILGISESWSTHSSPTSAVNISGSGVFRRDRGEEGGGGGLLVYVKSNFKCELITRPAEMNIECFGLNIIILKRLLSLFVYINLPLLKICFMINSRCF